MPAILVGLGIPFFVFAAAIVIVGLAQTHTATHGSTATPGFLDFISGRWALRELFGLAAKAGSYAASHFAGAQLRLLARWFIGMGTLTLGWFGIQAGFAEAIVHALERVVHRGDPKARAKAQTANTRAIRARHAADHANAHARAVGHALDGYKTRTEPRIHHLTHATTVVLPRDIGRVRTREGALNRDLTKLKERTEALEDGALKTFRWIRAHPRSAVSGVFAGAVVAALSRLGYGFLRCRNWRNLGKRMNCGMGAWILKSLELVTGFALGYLAVLKPEVLAEEAVDAVDGIEFVLTKILDN